MRLCVEDGCAKPAKGTKRCPRHHRKHQQAMRIAAGDLCSVDECIGPRYAAAGLCRAHERQVQKYGEIVRVIPRKVFQVEERDGLRKCRTCGQWKEPSKFVRARSSECRRCLHMPSRYGITHSKFEDLFNKQGRVCAICGTGTPGGNWSQWAVDHDHGCCRGPRGGCGNCVRGILCNNCNMGIGYFGDSRERLIAAAAYAARKIGDQHGSSLSGLGQGGSR